MAVQAIAEEVYRLLEDGSRWTKGVMARNEAGTPVHPENPHATCWCLGGALWKVAGAPTYNNRTYYNFRDTWVERINPCGMSYVNDIYGHAAVLAGLEKLKRTQQ